MLLFVQKNISPKKSKWGYYSTYLIGETINSSKNKLPVSDYHERFNISLHKRTNKTVALINCLITIQNLFTTKFITR